MIVQRIVKFREESAKLIQKNYKQYLIHKNLTKILSKHNNYYSIYPSKKPKKNISLKLFTDLRNPRIYKILPVRFCKVRNCYAFDIPKNKFPSHKKIMRFIFIIDNFEFIDNEYKIVEFGDEKVNQVDFKLYDKKEEKLNKIYKNIKTFKYYSPKKNKFGNKNNLSKFKSFAESDILNTDSDEDYIKQNQTLSIMITNNNKQFFNSNDYENYSSKTLPSTFLNDTEFREKKNKSKKKNKISRSRSILKVRSRSQYNFLGDDNNSERKKVSFGIVQFSY